MLERGPDADAEVATAGEPTADEQLAADLEFMFGKGHRDLTPEQRRHKRAMIETAKLPEREGYPVVAPKHRGSIRYLREQAVWRAIDYDQRRARTAARLMKLRCRAPAKGKAGKAGELCGKPIPDAQRVTRETCSQACKQRLYQARKRQKN